MGHSFFFTLLLSMIGTILLVRVAGYRSVASVVSTAVAAALLGSLLCFIYSGLGIGELLSDAGVYFSSLVVASATAVMASLELRRLPNTSLERKRDR